MHTLLECFAATQVQTRYWSCYILIFSVTTGPIWTKLNNYWPWVAPIINCIQSAQTPSKMAAVTKKRNFINGPRYRMEYFFFRLQIFFLSIKLTIILCKCCETCLSQTSLGPVFEFQFRLNGYIYKQCCYNYPIKYSYCNCTFLHWLNQHSPSN
jgi:hypothetical protein